MSCGEGALLFKRMRSDVHRTTTVQAPISVATFISTVVHLLLAFQVSYFFGIPRLLESILVYISLQLSPLWVRFSAQNCTNPIFLAVLSNLWSAFEEEIWSGSPEIWYGDSPGHPHQTPTLHTFFFGGRNTAKLMPSPMDPVAPLKATTGTHTLLRLFPLVNPHSCVSEDFTISPPWMRCYWGDQFFVLLSPDSN